MARRSPPLDIEETTTGKDYDMPLDDAVNRYHQASQNALGRIFDQEQLTPPDTRPRWSSGQYFDGRLPANWAGLDSRQIGELFEMLTGYADFLGTKVTLAKAERTNSEERLKLVKAKVRRAKTGNNDDKDDATLCDSRYIAKRTRNGSRPRSSTRSSTGCWKRPAATCASCRGTSRRRRWSSRAGAA